MTNQKTKKTGINSVEKNAELALIRKRQRIRQLTTMAILLLDSIITSRGKPRQWEKLNRIAYDRAGGNYVIAARILVLASLKALIKSGVARNAAEAISLYEQRQEQGQGIQGNDQSAILGDSTLARAVNRINKINHSGDIAYYTAYKVNGVMPRQADYIAVMRKDIAHNNSIPADSRVFGRYIGSMMINAELAVMQYTPAQVFADTQLQKAYKRASSILPAYFSDWIDRLSPTRQAMLWDIIESDVDADMIYCLSARQGKDGYLLSKLAWAAFRLYSIFPDRDSITPIQWIGLLRRYASRDKLRQWRGNNRLNGHYPIQAC